MNCLVTGGAGFIGSHLCEHLLAHGHTVAVIDNFNDYYDPRLKRRNVEPLLQRREFVLIEADVLDLERLQQIFGKYSFDAVIHLAARAGVRSSIAQPVLYEQVNVLRHYASFWKWRGSTKFPSLFSVRLLPFMAKIARCRSRKMIQWTIRSARMQPPRKPPS
jgi:UDP-glucose 4-epimerase